MMTGLQTVLKNEKKNHLYNKSGYPHKQGTFHNFIIELWDVFYLECLPS